MEFALNETVIFSGKEALIIGIDCITFKTNIIYEILQNGYKYRVRAVNISKRKEKGFVKIIYSSGNSNEYFTVKGKIINEAEDRLFIKNMNGVTEIFRYKDIVQMVEDDGIDRKVNNG